MNSELETHSVKENISAQYERFVSDVYQKFLEREPSDDDKNKIDSALDEHNSSIVILRYDKKKIGSVTFTLNLHSHFAESTFDFKFDPSTPDAD